VLLESAASLELTQKRIGKSKHSESYLLVFSAKHSGALQKLIDTYKTKILLNPPALADMSYTLSKRREFYNCRAFCVAATLTSTPLEMSPISTVSEPTKLIFTFTGQGAQWAQMGAELMEKSTIFRARIQALDTFLKTLPDPPEWSLESISQLFLLLLLNFTNTPRRNPSSQVPEPTFRGRIFSTMLYRSSNRAGRLDF